FQNWQSGGDVRLSQPAPSSPATQTDSIGPYFVIAGAGAAPNNTAPYYAYGTQAPSSFYVDSLDANYHEDGYQKVYLWYQYEASMTTGRPKTVTLPAGHYQCRLLITEESFHNNYGATSSPYGGKWATVMANEDFTKDANGNSVPDTSTSNDIVFDVPNSLGQYVVPPAAPSYLYFTTGSGQISLSWPAVSGATYYNIKRSTTAGSGYVKIAGGVNTKTTSYTDNTVVPGVGYYYVVSAVNSGVEGPNSSESQPQPAAPAAPSNLQARAVTGTKITLTWTDNSSNEQGFKIERLSGSTWTQIATAGVNVTTYTNSGLQRGKTYSYRVRAYNATGNSAYSNTASATAIR
ncbi:MAG: fibronectin type III domain-containing protein, partial [Abitibacteriaceae bacterium]|nr:fibronectin type III domain-containing protein [Abditibacteriaceae bacterium]